MISSKIYVLVEQCPRDTQVNERKWEFNTNITCNWTPCKRKCSHSCVWQHRVPNLRRDVGVVLSSAIHVWCVWVEKFTGVPNIYDAVASPPSSSLEILSAGWRSLYTCESICGGGCNTEAERSANSASRWLTLEEDSCSKRAVSSSCRRNVYSWADNSKFSDERRLQLCFQCWHSCWLLSNSSFKRPYSVRLRCALPRAELRFFNFLRRTFKACILSSDSPAEVPRRMRSGTSNNVSWESGIFNNRSLFVFFFFPADARFVCRAGWVSYGLGERWFVPELKTLLEWVSDEHVLVARALSLSCSNRMSALLVAEELSRLVYVFMEACLSIMWSAQLSFASKLTALPQEAASQISDRASTRSRSGPCRSDDGNLAGRKLSDACLTALLGEVGIVAVTCVLAPIPVVRRSLWARTHDEAVGDGLDIKEGARNAIWHTGVGLSRKFCWYTYAWAISQAVTYAFSFCKESLWLENEHHPVRQQSSTQSHGNEIVTDVILDERNSDTWIFESVSFDLCELLAIWFSCDRCGDGRGVLTEWLTIKSCNGFTHLCGAGECCKMVNWWNFGA